MARFQVLLLRCEERVPVDSKGCLVTQRQRRLEGQVLQPQPSSVDQDIEKR